LNSNPKRQFEQGISLFKPVPFFGKPVFIWKILLCNPGENEQQKKYFAGGEMKKHQKVMMGGQRHSFGMSDGGDCHVAHNITKLAKWPNKPLVRRILPWGASICAKHRMVGHFEFCWHRTLGT